VEFINYILPLETEVIECFDNSSETLAEEILLPFDARGEAA
jgi:hypothetical protein